MWRSRAAGRRGVPLRAYLTALVLVPLLTCAGFAGFALAGRISDARDSGRVESLVRDAGGLAVIEGDLQAELLPSLARVVIESPLLHQVAGLGSLQLSSIGLSDAAVSRLRAHTDADLRALAASRSQNTIVTATRRSLTAARKSIDSASATGVLRGYYAMIALADKLSAAAQSAVNRATALGSSHGLDQALRDVKLTSVAAQVAATQLVLLAGVQFRGIGVSSVTDARRMWLQSWAGFDSASALVATEATKPVARRWAQALAAPASKDFAAKMDALSSSNLDGLNVRGIVTLYPLNQARATRLGVVRDAAVHDALRAASEQRAASNRNATLIVTLIGLAVALSVAAAALVLRSITRPLNALSRQAALVSEGELVDVDTDGPSEVRTVATGLAAAVDNLRKIEAQASAVASGDLLSDIVLRPLPGPLGEVMHSSVATIIGAIHERDLAQSDLAYQATHDALTNLPNRVQALVSIRHALQRARRTGSPTGLMFIDLDYFKRVNDSHGHAAGDEVLRVCAERMRAVVRDSDTVFRLGGDEFVVLLEDITGDFAFVALAERLIEAVCQPIAIGAGHARVGASVGISLCEDASVDAERLLSEADAAAYSAKQNGRGRVGIFDDALRDSLTHRATLEKALVRALDEDEFVLHYQPVVELATGRPTGFEALIRWQHPELGLSYPNLFIPTAEKSVIINRIGRWTLREATGQLARWDEAAGRASDMTMAVNISGRHLASKELIPDVRAALDASGIEPRRLTVEITETVLVDDPIALHNMHELRGLGVIVAIDDFGTGYTSIGQLPRLPIDILKIDRSFIASPDPAQQQLVRLIVEAAHAFGLSVVAEGIELAHQVDQLSDVHVDTGQGFFFARPHPPQRASEIAAHASLPYAADDDVRSDPAA